MDITEMAGKQIHTKRSREISGIICIALAFSFLLALISYYPLDPSLTHYAEKNTVVHNLVGSFGSYVSDALIKLLGTSAFLLPIFFLIIASKYLLSESFKIGLMDIIGFAGLVFSISGFSTVIQKDIFLYGVKLDTGGMVGTLFIQLLYNYFNLLGTLILLTLLLAVSSILVINVSLLSLSKGLLKWIAALLKGIKNLVEQIKSGIARKHVTPIENKDKQSKTTPIIDEIPSLTGKTKRKKLEQTQFEFIQKNSSFKLPPLTLLDQIERRDTRMRKESLIMNSKILEKKLLDFGVDAKVIEVKPGPVITTYELEPAPGVKINKITNLSDDLALALKAPSIRIVAPIPGKAAIGIEIPNYEREPVHLKDVLDNEGFLESPNKIPIALGEDIVGSPVIADLIRMPHLLIAGTTGSGKSVSLNAMICSILFKATPDEVKLLMIDPKRLELSAYEGIPHLLHPVVVDPAKASQVLKWAVEEMENRYKIISELDVKNIESYNRMVDKKLQQAKASLGDRETQESKEHDEEMSKFLEATTESPKITLSGDLNKFSKLPYIVVVIDELADLMMIAQRDVEESLARLAQMSRAAGIHLILATQRPSVDVITGVIKANFPTRISFQVSSKVDSRTILDQLGAEKLLGSGDMLFIPPGTSKLTRIHGAYVSDKEIHRIVDFIKKQATPSYDESILAYEAEAAGSKTSGDDFDEKYDEAVELVTDLGQASISLVQRYLKIGYNRAARIIEHMEAQGIVGPSDGVKPRKVLARKVPHH
jgi:S-DNA-T family DNA segregation ATPase FtsK/SpoIIIE